MFRKSIALVMLGSLPGNKNSSVFSDRKGKSLVLETRLKLSPISRNFTRMWPW